MDQSGHASIALLMLDIASAKSTLAQLQQVAEIATTEHQRTIEQLDSFRKEYDVSRLYGRSATDGVKVTAHQLEMLHTENLQLKSILKQEVEARQQLEHQHSALLSLFRNSGVQELLASSQDTGTAHMGGNGPGPQNQAGWHADNSDGAGRGIAALASSSTETTVVLPEGRLGSLAPSPTSQQGVQGPQQGVDTGLAKARAVAGDLGDNIDVDVRQAEALGCHISAYFPTQQQHHTPSIATENQFKTPEAVTLSTNINVNLQQAAVPQQHPAADENLQASHWQRMLQQQHLQEHHHTIDSEQFAGSDAGPVDALLPDPAALHPDTSASESLCSSSSQSVLSDLLDSEDLQELAGLCDGLICQASKQQLGTTAVQHSTISNASAVEAPVAGSNLHTADEADCISAFREQYQHQQQYQHKQQLAPGTCWYQQQQGSKLQADSQQEHDEPRQKLNQYDELWNCPQHAGSNSSYLASQCCCSQHSSNVEMPGTKVSAADLCIFQQHVEASAVDLGPAAAAVRATLAGASSGRATTPTGASNTSTAAAIGGTAAGVTDLQQQLAARMAEVKQQLSNICNVMLEDVLADGESSAGSSPTAGRAAAGQSVQGYGLWQDHMQERQQALQQQASAPAAAAGHDNPVHWHHAAGALQHQYPAANSGSTSSMRKSSSAVTHDVHASGSVNGHAAPSRCTPGGSMSGSSIWQPPNRARVSGPALWPGIKASNATAATMIGHQSNAHGSSRAGAAFDSFRAPAFTAAVDGSSHAVRTGASVTTDSDSSWATVDECQDEAEQQQQQQGCQKQESQGQYGPAKHQHMQVETRAGAHPYPIRPSQLHNAGLPANRQPSTMDSDEEPHTHDFQTPLNTQHYQQLPQIVRLQAPADLEDDDTADKGRRQWHQPTMPCFAQCDQQYRTPSKQQRGAPVSEAHQDSTKGASPEAHGDGARGRCMQQGSSRGPQHQQQHQQYPPPPGRVSESLEGVLFGLKGRVAAEVSQTFSPLKAGGAAGGRTAPGSPVTPLKPRNF